MQWDANQVVLHIHPGNVRVLVEASEIDLVLPFLPHLPCFCCPSTSQVSTLMSSMDLTNVHYVKRQCLFPESWQPKARRATSLTIPFQVKFSTSGYQSTLWMHPESFENTKNEFHSSRV